MNLEFRIKKIFHYSSSGQSLIELLVAIGLTSILLPALITGLVASREGKASEYEQLQASAYLDEAVDAVRSVREKGWNANIANLSISLDYHPELAGTSWSLVSGSEPIGNFTRSINFADVQRDSSGNIVSSGGTLDPSTKRVTATVSWSSPYSSQISSSFYITRYLGNNSMLQPSPTPFSNYTSSGSSNIVVTSSNVRLDTAGGLGGQLATQGVYESTTFDAINTASFNRFQAIFDQPTGTNITFQVAVAPPVSGSCSGATFSYQDLNNVSTTTAGTTVTLTGTVPNLTSGGYQNPGQCFRYRATLTPSADFQSTPTLQSVTVNYSP